MQIVMARRMLEAYQKRHRKHKTIVELPEMLQMMWDVGQPAAGIDHRKCNEVFKLTETCVLYMIYMCIFCFSIHVFHACQCKWLIGLFVY